MTLIVNVVFDDNSVCSIEEFCEDENLIYDQSFELVNNQKPYETSDIEPDQLEVDKNHSAGDVIGKLDGERQTRIYLSWFILHKIY